MGDIPTQFEPEIAQTAVAPLSQSGAVEIENVGVKHVRDKDWYLNDGDVVLLVEDRLFKVHKFLFVRDSTFFRDLFSLPPSRDSNEGRTEGQSDENPIICHGDSVEDFRALCWGLYARPPEVLAQQNQDTVDIPKIARVLAMSHKYDIVVFRDWALDTLEAFSSVQPTDLFLKLSVWKEIRRTLHLASQCRRDALVERMEQTWLAFIRLSIGDSERVKFIAFFHALETAEHSSVLRQFHGKVYYAYLQKLGIFDLRARDDFGTTCITGSSSDIDQSLSEFSPQRKECIYRGFWSLTQLRLKLSQPPKLSDNPPCSGNHTRDCEPAWRAWWKRVLTRAARNGRQLNDPGELINEIQKRLVYPIQCRTPDSDSEIIPCNGRIEEQVNLMKGNFYDSLADRFLGPQ